MGGAMDERPDFLKGGEVARLFPILAESSKEKRVASIFLAVMTQIPVLSENVLGTVKVRIGKRTKIKAFTEVVLRHEVDTACRPDGLIVVSTGRRNWAALIEAKIVKAKLDASQVQRYMELAKANGIDAVITISNEFVARPDHSPVTVPKPLLRRVKLIHWSWSWLATLSENIAYQDAVEDSEQAYLLKQLNLFFAHPGTGIERFTQMAPSWKSVVQAVVNNEALRKTSPEIEELVAGWFAEEQDLCLHMARHVGREVTTKIARKYVADPVMRLKDGIRSLVETNTLTSTICIPDCASDIVICADIARRTVSVSMTVRAPDDRKSTKARVNWLLRMLKDNDPRLLLRAHWPKKARATMKEVTLLREDPAAIQTEKAGLVPQRFEVLMVERLGQRFYGRRTFIEDLERIVPEFYDSVGANLKAWQPPPPRPVKSRDDVHSPEAAEETAVSESTFSDFAGTGSA